MDDSKFRLALTVLNGLVGVRFNALQTAQGSEVRNEKLISRLKHEFQEACDKRDTLHEGAEDGLQALIEEYGPIVKLAVGGDLRADGGLPK